MEKPLRASLDVLVICPNLQHLIAAVANNVFISDYQPRLLDYCILHSSGYSNGSSKMGLGTLVGEFQGHV